MNTLSGWIIVCLFIVGCTGRVSPPVATRADTAQVAPAPASSYPFSSPEIVYFKATGTEPFWSLEISEDSLRFQSLTNDFKAFAVPHSEPAQAMDANVKRYQSATADGHMRVQIQQLACVNAMSGEESRYTVRVELKRSTDQKFTFFQGCGNYQIDYRLHDLWALEELGGKKVTPAQFEKQLPLLEIKAKEATFMGFAGCNEMNGQLFSERNRLRFIDIRTTRKACAADNQEAAFLKALRSATEYRLSNNRLSLSNPDGPLLVFRKVD
jgi:heat shock protein HslJ